MLNDMPKFDEEGDNDCEAFYHNDPWEVMDDEREEESDYDEELWAELFADPANTKEIDVEDIFSDEYHGKYCMCPLCEEYNMEEMELDFPGLSRYYDDSDTDEHRREANY